MHVNRAVRHTSRAHRLDGAAHGVRHRRGPRRLARAHSRVADPHVGDALALGREHDAQCMHLAAAVERDGLLELARQERVAVRDKVRRGAAAPRLPVQR